MRLPEPIVFSASYDKLFDHVLRGLREVRFDATRTPGPAETVEGQFSVTGSYHEAGVITASFDQFTLTAGIRPVDEEHSAISLTLKEINSPQEAASYSLPIPRLYLDSLVTWLDEQLERME